MEVVVELPTCTKRRKQQQRSQRGERKGESAVSEDRLDRSRGTLQ
ncbi:MAG TPA: hypothetical protein VL403_07100 [Candidatus Kryptonia bacterium]|nr:hypothetical protein [Candidatus Kryptonia bacterium]